MLISEPEVGFVVPDMKIGVWTTGPRGVVAAAVDVAVFAVPFFEGAPGRRPESEAGFRTGIAIS